MGAGWVPRGDGEVFDGEREGANWLDMIGNSRACIGIKNNITTLLDFLIVFYLVVTAESVYIYI